MIDIFAEKYREELLSAAQGVCRKLKVSTDDIGVEINIVDEEEIRSLNKEQRNIDKVTDVLSFQNLPDVRFPFVKDDYADDINPEDDSVFLGEIFICQKRAEEQAKEYDHTIERELSFLCCHGMLHLFGYDLDTEEEEKVMNDLCESVLSEIGQSDPLDPAVLFIHCTGQQFVGFSPGKHLAQGGRTDVQDLTQLP